MMPSAAIILAGGQGQRLGMGPKAFVQFNGISLLERAHAKIEAAGIEYIVSVLPKGLSSPLGPSIENPDPKSGPLESAQLGLSLLPTPIDTLLLFPVDHVKVSSALIESLLNGIQRAPEGCSRILPTYQGRDGHPIVLLEPGIQGLASPARNTHTLRDALEATGSALRIPAFSPEIFFNLNTPADWEDLHGQTPKPR